MRRRSLPLLTFSLAMIGLAACTTHPPVSYNQGGVPPAQRVPGASTGAKSEPATTKVVIKQGDTIYSLSQEYGVPIRDLISANRLEPPYHLRPGDLILLPPRRMHIVQRGDTLYGISRQFGLDIYSLARANDLSPPYTIRVGQKLLIPGGGEAPATAIAAAPAPSAEVSRPATGGAAQPSGPRLSTPVPAPAGPALPPPERPVPVADPPAQALPPAGAAAAPAPTQTPVPAPAPVAKPEPAEPHVALATPPSGPTPQPPATTSPPAPTSAPIPAPTPTPKASSGANPKFLWPVQGKILSAYGPKTGGLHNDGINIAARRGSEVRAAESGTVVYAGNELRGYGNLLLIRHADGWMTAYAHNESLKVGKGDRVNRGQVVAAAGATGNVSEPQVHFEVRRGAQAVDPSPFLVAGGI